MPVNIRDATTVPISPTQGATTAAHIIPLFAFQVQEHQRLVGGFTINKDSVPLVDGKRIAYAGDVFRRNDATKLFDYAAANDDGTGFYVMLEHDRDCTNANQGASGVLRNDHVNKGVLKHAIPAALLGAGKLFQYHIASPVDTWG